MRATMTGAMASMGATPMRVFRYSDTPSVNSSVPSTRCMPALTNPEGCQGSRW